MTTPKVDNRIQTPYQLLTKWGAPGAIIIILFTWIYMKEDAIALERINWSEERAKFIELNQYNQERFFESQEKIAAAISDLAEAMEFFRGSRSGRPD